MKHDYSDIFLAAHPKEPQWWDEHGVPRFCEFKPEYCPDFYAEEVILFEIACQDCGQRFKVQTSWSRGKRWVEQPSEALERHLVHHTRQPIWYGDPPVHDDGSSGGCTGNTMTSDTIRIIEFWRMGSVDWERLPPLEAEVLE